MMAAAPETRALSPINDAGFLANRRRDADMRIRSLLFLANREAACLNSEREGERVLFMLCEARVLPGLKVDMPKAVESGGHSFQLTNVPGRLTVVISSGIVS